MDTAIYERSWEKGQEEEDPQLKLKKSKVPGLLSAWRIF